MAIVELPPLHFRRPNRVSAYEVASWRHAHAQRRFDIPAEGATRLLSAEFAYVVALDDRGSVVGVACSGPDARINGGEYAAGPPRILDVLARLRPSLLGRGLGCPFLRASFAWLIAEHRPRYLRTTVEADNAVARHVLEKMGFTATWRFVGPELSDSRIQHYLQYECPAVEAIA